MTRAAAAPIDLPSLIAPLLNPIISAVADRVKQTQEEWDTEANAVEDMILSFQPRDAAEAMLVSQAVAFHGLIADSTYQVLRGLNDVLKTKRIAGIISLGRLTQGHLDRLKKRGNQPSRATIDAAEADGRDEPAAVAARAPSPEPAARAPAPPMSAPLAAAQTTQRPLAATPTKAAAQSAPEPGQRPEPGPELEPTTGRGPETAPAPDPQPEEPVYVRPVQPESWIDEPFQQWLIETPADLLLRKAAALAAEFEQTASIPRLPAAAPDRDTANAPPPADMELAAAGD